MNRKLLRIIVRVALALFCIHIIACGVMYVFQEKLIFHPKPIAEDKVFQMNNPFEELWIEAEDDSLLHGLYFPTEEPKGLVYFLHGNGGNVECWWNIADIYGPLGYDLFILDYRGYGKSQGETTSEAQFYTDAQTVYDRLLEEDLPITVIGFSIGTATAAKLAADNQPEQLILQAPYYGLEDMMAMRYPLVPTFLLNYKFPTHQYLDQVECPVTIFHGDEDRVIPVEESIRLQKHFKAGDELVVLKGQGHNTISTKPVYMEKVAELLR